MHIFENIFAKHSTVEKKTMSTMLFDYSVWAIGGVREGLDE